MNDNSDAIIRLAELLKKLITALSAPGTYDSEYFFKEINKIIEDVNHLDNDGK